MRNKFIAGNWKMFKTTKEAVAFLEEFKMLYTRVEGVEVAICAPFMQLDALKQESHGTDVRIGAQNMHYEEEGAFTGEISVAMLDEVAIDLCVIGHSERRQYFAETDQTVNLKLKKAFEHGITPIMCVGEKLEERDAGEEKKVIHTQLTDGLLGIDAEDIELLVIAYEPVWAIGTGRTASPEQAQEMCKYIREVIAELYTDDVASKVLIQYGGSVKPANASELLNQDDIDGALVGGASLKPEDFIAIINF